MSPWKSALPTPRSRMWSQYAEDHTGACLVFDRDRLVKTAQQHARGAPVTADLVRYQNGPFIDAPPPIDFNRLAASEAGAYARDFFFLDIRESLVGVILGDRFPAESVPVVREAIGGYHAEVVRLDWTSRFPLLLRPDKDATAVPRCPAAPRCGRSRGKGVRKAQLVVASKHRGSLRAPDGNSGSQREFRR